MFCTRLLTCILGQALGSSIKSRLRYTFHRGSARTDFEVRRIVTLQGTCSTHQPTTHHRSAREDLSFQMHPGSRRQSSSTHCSRSVAQYPRRRRFSHESTRGRCPSPTQQRRRSPSFFPFEEPARVVPSSKCARCEGGGSVHGGTNRVRSESETRCSDPV